MEKLLDMSIIEELFAEILLSLPLEEVRLNGKYL